MKQNVWIISWKNRSGSSVQQLLPRFVHPAAMGWGLLPELSLLFLVLATLLYILILATCEFWLASLQMNYSVFSRARRSFGCFRTRGPGEAPTPFQHRSRSPHRYSHLLFTMTTSVSPLGWNHLGTNWWQIRNTEMKADGVAHIWSPNDFTFPFACGRSVPGHFISL